MIALLMLLCACGGDEEASSPPPTISVAEVGASELSDRILTSATLQASRWQSLYFQQGGLVASVLVDEGDRVGPSQRLASLDTAGQENQVASSRLQVASAELEHEQALHRLAAARTMEASGAYSAEQVYEREQQEIEARNRVDQATLNLRGNLIRLDQMRLSAPFDGVVAEVNIRVGDQVMGNVQDPDAQLSSRPPMLILDPTAFELRTTLPEGQAMSVGEGTKATVSLLEAPDVRMDGAVTWVAPSVDRASRTVALKVGVESPSEGGSTVVRDGSAVRVEIHADPREAAATVPEAAMYYFEDRAHVFVVDGDVVRRTEVHTGVLRDGRVEIRDGVLPGDRVATSQVYLLQDGQKVRVE